MNITTEKNEPEQKVFRAREFVRDSATIWSAVNRDRPWWPGRSRDCLRQRKVQEDRGIRLGDERSVRCRARASQTRICRFPR